MSGLLYQEDLSETPFPCMQAYPLPAVLPAKELQKPKTSSNYDGKSCRHAQQKFLVNRLIELHADSMHDVQNRLPYTQNHPFCKQVKGTYLDEFDLALEFASELGKFGQHALASFTPCSVPICNHDVLSPQH
jgi:hypothetical protein